LLWAISPINRHIAIVAVNKVLTNVAHNALKIVPNNSVGEIQMKFVVKPAAYFETAYCYGCVNQCQNVCGEQCIKDRTK
jgi:Cys-rich peptide (Clo7bot family)